MPSLAGRWLILALACCLCAVPLANGPGIAGAENHLPVRDWKTQPAIVEIDTKHDVYALGDIHGDYDRLVTLLVAGKIIQKDPPTPEKVRWAAGRSVLVCTGDVIDKWIQSLPVLALLRALQSDAAAAGGRVVVVMGNHEAEFLAAGGRNKKAADFVKELTAKGIKPEDVAAGKDALGAGAFLRRLPFAARVNDWFFAHACNTQGRSLVQLRSELQEGVDARGFNAPVLSAPDSLLQARLHPAPWWERSGDSAETARERLAGYVKALGVRHLVMGHQPAKVRFADGSTRRAGELSQQMDGLIFLIDVGMNRKVGYSTGALLRIHAGKPARASAIFANGSTKQVWAGPK